MPTSWAARSGSTPKSAQAPAIPPLDDLTRMLSPQELEALWKYPQARQYHASAAWSIFATIDAVRYRAGEALRPTQEPRGLRRQVPARKLRQRPGAIRGVQCAHGCGQTLDRRHLLDAQQRVALAALASVRLFPESGRRLLRRQDRQRAGAHPVLIRYARDHVGQSHAHP